ncbi:MAG: hypothetical protein HC769_07850 [Cyanobacteria bacterium CRU_2_1]|nr:hypothetical protein [Cyanobacteria bacterium RU_5_0]NJR58763.1 hypothetical protein [Cyanobacteria bacterium CRU_2_1]
MNASDAKPIHLAQASLEHAVYFLELGATDRAASYLEFAMKNLQEATEKMSSLHNVTGLHFKSNQI